MQSAQKWIEKQELLLKGDESREIKPKRNYLHFDNRVSSISPEIQSYIFDKSAIEAHSFFPFIRYTTSVRKRKKSGKGIRVKKRNISYASHTDSLIYSWYAHQLNDLYESLLSRLDLTETVLAYRQGNGSNVDHACKAFRNIQSLGGSHVVCMDVKSFFDTLNHKILKEKWLQTLQQEKPELTELPNDHYSVYKAITKFSHIQIEDIYNALELDPKDPKPKERTRLCSALDFRKKIAEKGLIESNRGVNSVGIPQGSSMSAILANIYMLDFDIQANQKIKEWGGFYYRYSDDVLFAVPSTISVDEVVSFVIDKIKEIDLKIGEDKTEKYSFLDERGIHTSRNIETKRKKNIDYLGLSFDGRRIFLKHASLAGYQRKVVASVRRALRYKHKENAKMPKRNIYKRYTRMGKSNYQSYVTRCVTGLEKYGFSASFLKKQASDFFVHKTIKRLDEVVRLEIERKRLIKQRRGRAT
jgi:hypothetical protein